MAPTPRAPSELQIRCAPIADYEPFNGDGIYLDEGAYNNTIGGLTAAARNIIAGNVAYGVQFGNYATANTVEGNYVGVDVTGSNALGNGYSGIEIASGSDSNVIGGTTAVARNVISGNGVAYAIGGIDIDGGAKNVVQGNYIGTDAAGAAAIGNQGDGVLIEAAGSDNTVGGTGITAQNVIAYNTNAGVVVQNNSQSGGGAGGPNSAGNTVRLNSIYANAGLGIDLGADGITANDPQDADTGANGLQNFPVIVTATATASGVTVAGTFNSLPSVNFTLDFYANDTIDAYGNSQGRQYLGSLGVITDAGGNATFSGTFNVALGGNRYITATATNESTAPYGDTSEFSQAVEANAAASQATPLVSVMDGSGPYTSLAFAAGGSVTGVGGANLGSPTFTYYAGTYPTVASLSGQLPGAPVDVGAYTVLASYGGSGGYASAAALANFTISRKAVTVTTSNAGKVYGQADPSPLTSADLSGFYAIDGITATFSRAAGEAVGPYHITTTLAGSAVKLGDYDVTNTGATFTISQATPLVSVMDGSGPYTSLAFAAGGSVTGVGGANLGSPTFTYYAGTYLTVASLSGQLPGAPVDVGAYTVLASYGGSGGYASAAALANFTISRKAVTVTTSNAGKVYGQADPSPLTSADLSGFYAIDGITATFSRAAGEDVGPYHITTTLAGSAVKLGDYDVTNTGATFTISPANTSGPGSYVIGSELWIVGANTNDQVQIVTIGSSKTGSTGIKVTATLNRVQTTIAYNQSFTLVRIFGYGGNDTIQLPSSLTINAAITVGDGNNVIQLGNGNNTVTLGNGADTIVTGNGNDVIVVGNGNDTITVGNGNKTITAGTGNDTVKGGTGTDAVSLGGGKDSVQLAGGNNTVTLGNGNDTVTLGNGNNVVTTGNGTDTITAGNGNNLIAAGLGQHTVLVGNGSNILIDGSVTLTKPSSDSLRQVLNDWISAGKSAANVAGIRSRLHVTFNSSHANKLTAGTGLNWFWATYAKDVTNRKPSDILN